MESNVRGSLRMERGHSRDTRRAALCNFPNMYYIHTYIPETNHLQNDHTLPSAKAGRREAGKTSWNVHDEHRAGDKTASFR